MIIRPGHNLQFTEESVGGGSLVPETRHASDLMILYPGQGGGYLCSQQICVLCNWKSPRLTQFLHK